MINVLYVLFLSILIAVPIAMATFFLAIVLWQETKNIFNKKTGTQNKLKGVGTQNEYR